MIDFSGNSANKIIQVLHECNQDNFLLDCTEKNKEKLSLYLSWIMF